MARKPKEQETVAPVAPEGAAVEATVAEVLSGAADTQPGPEAASLQPAPPEVLIVRGPQRGRWRAGRHFGPDEVHIAIGDLTDDELDAIVGDPLLSHRRA